MNRAIIIGAIVVSAAILLNGYLDRAKQPAALAHPAGTREAREKSIAVLPFADLSSSPAAAGIAVDVRRGIARGLSDLRDLRVTPLEAVAQHSPAPHNVRALGESLGVAFLLEGSVRGAGDRVRIHVQLIDAKADQHVFAESYDVEASDVRTVESNIAQKVASELGNNKR